VSFAVSFIPLVSPLISCVIDGTFVDMWEAIKRGDWGALAMCAMAFVPGGKALKGLKFADDIGKSTKSLRKNLIRATGKDPGKAFEAHHVLPKKHAKFFESKDIDINQAKYGSWVEKGAHRADAYSYNKDWSRMIRSGDLKGVNDIEAYARQLSDKYGFEVFF